MCRGVTGRKCPGDVKYVCVFTRQCTFTLLYPCADQVKIQVSKETSGGIPIWIIIMSILIGLLILALVIFALWKVKQPPDFRVFQNVEFNVSRI